MTDTNNNLFILYVWPGEWDLPSLDPECLTVMCYLKYNQLDHKIIVVNKAWDFFKNDYPRLEYKNKTYVGIDNIIQCFRKEKNIDLLLTDNNYPDMVALLSWFKNKFIPAFNALCWMDEENTYNVIRRAYGNHLKFPLSLIKLKQMSLKNENLIMSEYKSTHVQFDNIKQQIIYDAKECLNAISSKLEENLFMFENRPSLIDAYLFGYLSILNKAPFKNSALKNHLTACSNLVSLTSRIQREMFPIDKIELEKKRLQSQSKILNWLRHFSFTRWNKKGSSTSPVNQLADNEEWEKRKQQIFAISVALTAMLVYAFAIGFIRIDIIKSDLEYIVKE